MKCTCRRAKRIELPLLAGQWLSGVQDYSPSRNTALTPLQYFKSRSFYHHFETLALTETCEYCRKPWEIRAQSVSEHTALKSFVKPSLSLLTIFFSRHFRLFILFFFHFFLSVLPSLFFSLFFSLFYSPPTLRQL